MKLNYMAYTHPACDHFAFFAKDDEAAKEIITAHLKESGGFRGNIHPWNAENKEWNYDKTIEVSLPEPQHPQKIEYKLETTYFKYVKFEGTMTEDQFYQATRNAARALDQLPHLPGWQKRFESEATHCTDDERYGVKNVETIQLKPE